MTEYDTLLAARRLLATVEAGRAASLSLAAAYLPLRSAAALRESFQDEGAESSSWPEAAVERRLAIERLRRATPRFQREPAPDPSSQVSAQPFGAIAELPAARPAISKPMVPPPAADVAPLAEFDLAGESGPEIPLARPADLSAVDNVRVGRPNRRLVPQDMLTGLPKRISLPPGGAPLAEAPGGLPEHPAPLVTEQVVTELVEAVVVAPEEAPPLDVVPELVSADEFVAEPAPPSVEPTSREAEPPARPQAGGLAARLGGLARQPDAAVRPVPSAPRGEAQKPVTQVHDRRRDERIARRIALGHPERREHAVDPSPIHEPPPVSVAPPVVAPEAVAPELPAPPIAVAPVEAADEDRPPAEASPAEPTSHDWGPPAASLRSLAASLGGIKPSLPPGAPTPVNTPSLSLDAPRQIPPPQAPAAPVESDLDGPYITLETPVLREAAARSTTATIEVRAAARIGSGGDETIALEGKDGPHEDTSDDDTGEGMRVHFEVASPSRAAPAGPASGQLSFDHDDLAVVGRVDEERTESKAGPPTVDQGARRLSDDAALQHFLDAARQHTDRGEYPKAIQAFTDALDIRLTHSEAYIGRGRCHMELGDYTSAMSDFRRAEDLQPKHPDPQVAMGDLYFARKEYKRAIEFYDQAVELDGAHAMARCRRGISHYYRKNFRQAFQDLQRANALDPEIPNIKKYVQMALKKMERGE